MTKEEELQKYMMTIEQCKEQLSSFEEQFNLLQNIILEQTRAKMTIDSLSKLKDDLEILMPIGAGAFINATAKKKEKILLDVGDGIVIEKETKDAIEKIDNRIDESQKAMEKISKIAQQVQTELDNSTLKAQELIGKQK